MSTLSTIGNVLGKIGGAIISNVVPGGSLIVDAINAVLPDDKKLPANATGTAATQAISTLPPDQQLALLGKEVDLDIAEVNAWAQVQASLADADKSGASTRPKIAVMMAWTVVYAIVAFITAWIVCISAGKQETLKALADSWPLMVAVLGTPTALLRAYFAMRTREKRARYSAATGQPAPGGNLLMDIVKVIKGQGVIK